MNFWITYGGRVLTLVILLYSCCFSLKTVAQDRKQELEKLEALETTRAILKKQQLNMQLDTAIQLSKQGVYADANTIFINLLSMLDKVPSKLVYYFGANSFYLKKYTQSIDWLNKYIELKGATGKFSKKALSYLKEAEKHLVESKKTDKSLTSTPIPIWSWDHTIPCDRGNKDKIICPVCHGNTVIAIHTFLNTTYQACPYCSHKGYVNCEEYNKIVKGESHQDAHK